MKQQNRVLAIHDISCLGRCSLTVALPIISAAGIECAVVPTALLSTHTGGFEGFTKKDLTSEIMPIANHWKSLGVKFDVIYTGYLASVQQVEKVIEVVKMFKTENTVLIVDPVMADGGKLYSSFDKRFPSEMTKLCSLADIIIPNITEASLLAEIKYKKIPHTEQYISELLKKLYEIFENRIVLTGVCFDNNFLGAAILQKDEQPTYCFGERINGNYHGTGDIFASTIVCGILSGKNLVQASEIAVEFTRHCISITDRMGTDPKYGVSFELAIPKLLQLLND